MVEPLIITGQNPSKIVSCEINKIIKLPEIISQIIFLYLLLWLKFGVILSVIWNIYIYNNKRWSIFNGEGMYIIHPKEIYIGKIYVENELTQNII